MARPFNCPCCGALISAPKNRPGRPLRSKDPTEREQAMIALYESGKTLEETGLSFGITRERVRQILIKRGNGTRGHSANLAVRQAKVAETDAKVSAAHSRGLSPTEIQRATGLSSTTVRKSTDRLGLRPNRLDRRGHKLIKALTLFDEGLPAAQIAVAVGYKNENSVRAALWRNGRRFADRQTTNRSAT